MVPWTIELKASVLPMSYADQNFEKGRAFRASLCATILSQSICQSFLFLLWPEIDTDLFTIDLPCISHVKNITHFFSFFMLVASDGLFDTLIFLQGYIAPAELCPALQHTDEGITGSYLGSTIGIYRQSPVKSPDIKTL